ncbi:MAG: helix-turn-helix transcriptional regulator [Sulfurimonas sp.]|nr:helix-turn-helix transcriptional regulator [Sulfurimonas sp.]
MQLYEIGPKIKELRKNKKITQESLSKLSGISRVTLGKLERGEVSSVSIKTLDIILDALSYEIDIKYRNSNSFGLPALDEL